MNFCKGCNFMLYTKLEKNGLELINYCKHCGLESEYVTNFNDKSICVYKKNYSNDFLAERSFTNKYTKYDPTLPRINNIICVNPNCLSNKNDNTSYLKKNDNSKFIDSEKDLLLKDYVDKFLKNKFYNNNELLVITFKNIEDRKDFETKINKKDYILEPPKECNREIIFIKYDYINLKYLYLCTSCDKSWTNE